MKLNEAIRLGAMLHPQGFGSYATTNLNGRVLATCTIGAARMAGFSSFFNWRRAAPPIWCPECVGLRDLGSTIIHLNDDHCWTRERIADWLEASGHDIDDAVRETAAVV
jgi:hypothetical protein